MLTADNPAAQAAIEKALLRIADNIAKHFINRDGWSKDDSCFQMDLRQSQAELTQLLNGLMQPDIGKRLYKMHKDVAHLKQMLRVIANQEGVELP